MFTILLAYSKQIYMLTIANHIISEANRSDLPHNPSRLIQPRYIVLHYSAGTSLAGSISHLRSSRLSYHLLVDRDGSVIQSVPLNIRGSHAGTSNWKGLDLLNSYSIGICAANRGYINRFPSGEFGSVNSHNDPTGPMLTEEKVFMGQHFNGSLKDEYWEKYPPEQIAAIRDLCSTLVMTYPSIIDVVGHDEIAVNRKFDPGPAFPIQELYDLFPNRKTDRGGVYEVNSPTTGKLNVRRGPSHSFKLVGELEHLQRVVVRSFCYRYVNGRAEKTEWASISANEDLTHDGFVNTRLLRRI
jgi:N-acetylmuramoyl-L-alanine amidase